MDGETSIFGDDPQPLPDTAYVPLTQAITWIGYNDARDDDYFVDCMNEEAKANFDKWHSIDGAEWLLPHLELLEQGKTWEDVPDVLDYDLARLSQQLSSIERWLEREGRDLKSTINEVVSEVRSKHEEAEPFHQAMDLIWNAAASKEVILQGLIIDTYSKTTEADYSSIPFRYFLRPVMYFWGNGPDGKGQLCPKPPDTDEELFDMVTTRPDERPNYINVLIRRDDVLRLEKRYREQLQPKAQPRGGRPKKYDWPTFNDEALRVLEDEGEPGLEPGWASLADLERRMSEWCQEAWGRVPGEASIRRYCKSALSSFRKRRADQN